MRRSCQKISENEGKYLQARFNTGHIHHLQGQVRICMLCVCVVRVRGWVCVGGFACISFASLFPVTTMLYKTVFVRVCVCVRTSRSSAALSSTPICGFPGVSICVVAHAISGICILVRSTNARDTHTHAFAFCCSCCLLLHDIKVDLRLDNSAAEFKSGAARRQPPTRRLRSQKLQECLQRVCVQGEGNSASDAIRYRDKDHIHAYSLQGNRQAEEQAPQKLKLAKENTITLSASNACHTEYYEPHRVRATDETGRGFHCAPLRPASQRPAPSHKTLHFLQRET